MPRRSRPLPDPSAHKARDIVVDFLIAIAFLLAASPAIAQTKTPYYGFYPSEKGADFKRFKHNIFGFAIDIPASWTFGVRGKTALAVVFVYPEGMNIATLSADWQALEIGRLPYNGVSLKQGYEYTVTGLRTYHKSLEIVDGPESVTVGKNSALRWTQKWPSKTGLTIYEYIALVEDNGSIRSLAARWAGGDFLEKRDFFDQMIATFEPFAPEF